MAKKWSVFGVKESNFTELYLRNLPVCGVGVAATVGREKTEREARCFRRNAFILYCGKSLFESVLSRIDTIIKFFIFHFVIIIGCFAFIL